jgi:hypothetical protein
VRSSSASAAATFGCLNRLLTQSNGFSKSNVLEEVMWAVAAATQESLVVGQSDLEG